MDITSLDRRHTKNMEAFIEFKDKDLSQIYNHYSEEFDKDEILQNHRFHIEKYNLGFGERAFHAMWKDIINLMPPKFKFLEIGVYKGQVLSLVKLLSDHNNKEIEFYGVSPLNDVGDKFSRYESTDYLFLINGLFDHFNLDFDPGINLIKGSSNDIKIKAKIESLKHFDLMYIDGSHDYEFVISDIELMKSVCSPGAIIVFDDSACYKNLPSDKFRGHIDVCDAIRDKIENDSNFIEVLCVGHNRVFRKLN